MKTARRLSVLLLLTAGIPSLYVGLQLVLDPTGASVGLSDNLLNDSIFHDYAMLGWITTITMGISSLLLIVSILVKTSFYSFGLLIQGMFICIWVLLMMLLLDHILPVEYLFLLNGVALIVLGFWQYERKIVSEAKRME